MTETPAERRKRLLYQSRYRGVRESDLLFRQFSDTYLHLLNDGQLDRLELLMQESDQDILAWVTGLHPVPDRHDNDVFNMLREVEIVS
ncbi:MAG: succinate dehydrogenase assembly factor 2 [Geminicoccaceae bacterium]